MRDAVPPEIVCVNCHQPFDPSISTRVILVDITDEGADEDLWFHDQDCLDEWEAHGGQPRP
jgi:hypothetical protein